MTAQTLEQQQIAAWLAEKPCPECGSNPPETKGTVFVDGPGTVVDCDTCLDSNGKPTGLANPWASEECPRKPTMHGHQGCGSCNGSGRVARDITIEDVLEHSTRSQRRRILVGLAAQEDGFTLEAIRLFMAMQIKVA